MRDRSNNNKDNIYLIRLSKELGVKTQANVARVAVADKDADTGACEWRAIVGRGAVRVDAQHIRRHAGRRRGFKSNAPRSDWAFYKGQLATQPRLCCNG